MPNVQSTRWCFTINNPTDDDRDRVVTLFENRDQVKYGVVGRETGENGTPHLQCFVLFERNWRFNRLRNALPRAHVEVARGLSRQAAEYCKKDGDFDEYGELPDNQGQRNDLTELFQWGDDFTAEHGRPPSSPEIARAFPNAYLKYPRITRLFEQRAEFHPIQQGEPREWQDGLEQELDEPCEDDRKVVFYVDREGNSGKTWFCRWFLSKHPERTQVLAIGKKSDLAFAVDTRKDVFLFNVGRDEMQFLQYPILEGLKDRMFFSSKYRSGMKFLHRVPHVVVFCNEEPDMSKLSADRYDIRYI